MNAIHKCSAYAVFGAVVALFSSCAYPVKVTGGGKAVGLVRFPEEGVVLDNIPATASGQAQLTEETADGFTGKGTFQFVDHVNGVAFNADLEFGGRSPSILAFLDDDFWFNEWDGNFENLAYGEGPARLRESNEEVWVRVWMLDQREQGPDKGDRVVVEVLAESGYPGILLYRYDGALQSGNYKIHLIKD